MTFRGRASPPLTENLLNNIPPKYNIFINKENIINLSRLHLSKANEINYLSTKPPRGLLGKTVRSFVAPVSSQDTNVTEHISRDSIHCSIIKQIDGIRLGFLDNASKLAAQLRSVETIIHLDLKELAFDKV